MTGLDDALLMLVIVNPFAQMVYLADLMADSTPMRFRAIIIMASILTFVICFFFALVGESLLFDVFQVSLPAMRIFGGLIIFGVAYSYIVTGPQGLRLFRGDISEIAQQVALPLMVGPGVIWLAIRIGKLHPTPIAASVIGGALAVNLGAVLAYHWFYTRARGRIELALIKYFSMMMRLNALLIGAVAVEMVLSGLSQYVHSNWEAVATPAS